jgi:thiol:disulfide interchange protein DsbD
MRLLLAPLLLCPWVAGSAQAQNVLEPVQALRFHGQADYARAVREHWVVGDGYYPHGKILNLSSSTLGMSLPHTRMPVGAMTNDKALREVETDPRRFSEAAVRGERSGAPLAASVRYQGCANFEVCYPDPAERVGLVLAEASPPEEAPASLRNLQHKLGLGSEQRDFLDPDQAFVLSTELAGPNAVLARWEIADGYYLYRDRLKLQAVDAPNVELGGVEMPVGETKHDEFLGDTEVYHHHLQVRIPLIRSGAATASTPLTLKITYQGCAEAGLCYPPITKEASFSLPAAAESKPSTPTAGIATPLPEQDRIAGSLASGSTPLVLASFFLFGLLLAFTPCVFPMIPILSSIIVGQGRGITMARALSLSVVYVFAMAITYTAAGVVAGLFGENLQATFQNPWLLGTFSVVFVLLALSMFGFYELQLPSRWQSKLTQLSSRQRGGSSVGVALMGFLSALIVGPCVAPPLAGALIYIGHSGDAMLGGTALFAMSLGMGAPLLAVGASAGKLLPKAGPWMDSVKAVFGVVLLGLAIWTLERIVPPGISLALWGALLVVCGVYLGALEPIRGGSGWRKLWKGIGWMSLLYGSVLLVGAAMGGEDVWRPLTGLGKGSADARAVTHLAFLRIKSIDDLQRELAAAKSRRQPAILDFYADWCIECKRMEKYTFSDPAVQRTLSGVLLLQADVTANDPRDKALLKRLGLIGPPATLFYRANGEESRQHRLVGYLGPDRFALLVRSALG